MTAIPAAAITAAENTLRGFLGPWLTAAVHDTTLESQIHTAACIAVRDAAPHIAAAERAHEARIAQVVCDMIRSAESRPSADPWRVLASIGDFLRANTRPA